MDSAVEQKLPFLDTTSVPHAWLQVCAKYGHQDATLTDICTLIQKLSPAQVEVIAKTIDSARIRGSP